MFRCKHCKGFVYEEEIYWDDSDVKMQQLGCYQCSKKVYVEYTKWVTFKSKVNKAVGR